MVHLRYELVVNEGVNPKKGDFSAVAKLYFVRENWKEAQKISFEARQERGEKYIFSLFDCLHCAYTARGRKRGDL